MVFAVIILVTINSLFSIRHSITETLSKQLDDRVSSIGSDVAAKSSDLLLTNNIYALQKLVNDTKSNNNDIEYVFILNERGRPIVHTYGQEKISKELKGINQAKEEAVNLVMFDSEKGTIRDVAVPIGREFFGTARVGLREDSLKQAINDVTTQMFSTMFIGLVLSFLIVHGLTSVITLPITKLVNSTKRVSKGDFTSRINNFPNDEIGKLTRSFNTMLDDLEKERNTKEKYFNEIVTQNRELTLLNSIPANITSMEELKIELRKLIKHIVQELSLNSAFIHIRLSNKVEIISEFKEKCLIERNFDGDEQRCVCESNEMKINNSFPLFIKEDYCGKVQICNSKTLDPYTVKILKSISNQLSVTFENIQLWEEVKNKEKIRQKLLEKIMSVQEEERKRIARELHDETSHSLSSMLLGLKVLQEASTDEAREEQIRKLRKLTQATIEEVHDLAWQLRPSILDKFGLKVAIERYLEEFRNKYPVELDLIINGIDTIRLRPEIETAIFRIVQESLTNILKYANASSVSVIIVKNQHLISVMVEDDGVGFLVDEVLNKEPSKYNLGLRGMQERISLLGGTFNIEAAPHEGTSIMVKIPLNEVGGEFHDRKNHVS
nr:histidine kinase [Bacillus sp. B15-48]